MELERALPSTLLAADTAPTGVGTCRGPPWPRPARSREFVAESRATRALRIMFDRRYANFRLRLPPVRPQTTMEKRPQRCAMPLLGEFWVGNSPDDTGSKISLTQRARATRALRIMFDRRCAEPFFGSDCLRYGHNQPWNKERRGVLPHFWGNFGLVRSPDDTGLQISVTRRARRTRARLARDSVTRLVLPHHNHAAARLRTLRRYRRGC